MSPRGLRHRIANPGFDMGSNPTILSKQVILLLILIEQTSVQVYSELSLGWLPEYDGMEI